MKHAVLSDVHGNLQALEAVLESIGAEGIVSVICAGDIVGYGADPGECIDRIRAVSDANVIGNHDAAVAGKTGMDKFNQAAARAVEWTKKNLNDAHIGFLEGLPFISRQLEDVSVVHGTLHDPEKFIYMITGSDAMHTFEIMKGKVCFLGHSHRPGVFTLRQGRIYQSYRKDTEIDGVSRYIVNVGSVGQPRDNDPRACYCIYDDVEQRLEFRRIEYDIETARKRIIGSGLPEYLGDRLLIGR